MIKWKSYLGTEGQEETLERISNRISGFLLFLPSTLQFKFRAK